MAVESSSKEGAVLPPAPAGAAWVPSQRLAYPLILLTVTIWAAQLVITRGVHEQVPPVALSFWRWFIGAMILFPFVLPQLKRHWSLIKSNFHIYMMLGAIIITASTTILVALSFTTATNATLVNAAQPAVTSLLGVLFFSQFLARGQMAGVAIAFLGVALVAVKADWQVLANFEFNTGDMLVMAANCGFALYSLNLGKVPKQLSLHASLFLIAICGCALCLPVYIAESIFYKPVDVNPTSLTVLIGFGLFFTVISLTFWNAGVSAVGPVRASIFLNLLPILGAILAVIFLGERVHSYHFIGILLVCVGITGVIAMQPKRPKSPAAVTGRKDG